MTLDKAGSGWAEAADGPFPDDIRVGTDRGGRPWSDAGLDWDGLMMTPRAEANEYSDVPDRRFDRIE